MAQFAPLINLLPNATFTAPNSNWTFWETPTYTSEGATFNINAIYAGLATMSRIAYPLGHKLYCRTTLQSNNTIGAGIRWFGGSDFSTFLNQYFLIGTFLEETTLSEVWSYEDVNTTSFDFTIQALTENVTTVRIKEAMVIDLTVVFGAGKEPTKAWCDKNIPLFDKEYSFTSITLENLIGDSSFENDLWNGANYSTSEKLFGNRSLYFPSGTTYVPNIEIPRPIIGHKYYGRRYIKSAGENTPADCRFEVWGADGENKNWVYAWNQGNHPEWTFHSSIHQIAATDYPETDRTIIRCFNVNTTADTWVDGLMLIDLTETFGINAEPSLEWCDKNIPYFVSTCTIEKPNTFCLGDLDINHLYIGDFPILSIYLGDKKLS